ncbi:MAG: ABC-F family ATP-binding cassette domain-containing protein [Solobacterium sp.]|nr:ABC-F family ATP-binding cassette domain-containing protein [Solobacterium sp.]
MLYQVSHAAKYFGADAVFEDVQFEIRSNEKIAVVGRNGSGKTTFLRCMCGETSFDKGTVSMPNGTTIGYLAQKQLEDDELTVRETLMQVYTRIFELQAVLHELEEKMTGEVTDRLLAQYASVQERFEALNGYHWESEMMTVFTRFGFRDADLDRKINEFSGGQKTRIAFVRLLLSKPDILLLDEPTNHLDLNTIVWLENYVRNYPNAVVTVSHDRMFLDRTSDVVYDLEYGKMTRYTGNYSSFVEQKKNSIERRQAAYERQQKDIERLEALIDRFRYKKNKAAFAQSKIKYLEHMDKLDPVQKADDRTFKAKFVPRLKGGERVLDVENLTVGYDQPLCTVTLSLRRGDKVAVIGDNGTGKSTFVKTLMGQVPPLSGSWLFGHQIETGYFDQQIAQLSSTKTVLEELWDEYPELDRTAVRTVLGRFLFSADDVFKTVDMLSGGEKVRLSLAKLLLRQANLLILDEPTNHLDIPGKEALEDALSGFTGTLLFVSHDRYFISRLATSLLVLDGNEAVYYPLTYSEYTEAREKEKAAVVQEEKPAEVKQEKRALSPEAKRREIKRVEEAITRKEAELEEKRALRFDESYYHDYRRMNELEEEIDTIHNELEHMYEQWEILNQ